MAVPLRFWNQLETDRARRHLRHSRHTHPDACVGRIKMPDTLQPVQGSQAEAGDGGTCGDNTPDAMAVDQTADERGGDAAQKVEDAEA